MTDVPTAVAHLGERLRRRSDAWSDATELPPDVVEDLVHSGTYRMALAAELGGAGLALPTVSELIEGLAVVDGSLGWLAAVANVSASLLAGLSRGAAEQIAADPELCIAGGYAPSGRARSAGDHFIIDGRWSFASGCTHSTWLLGGVIPIDEIGNVTGQPMVAFFAASAATIEPNWDVTGLRTTGSHDVIAKSVEVEKARTCSLTSERWSDDPIARIPFFTLGPALIGSVLLGLGQRALEEILALAPNKTPFGRSCVLADDEWFQEELCVAAGDLRGAQVLMRDACVLVHDAACADKAMLGTDLQNEMWLCAHVARRAAARAAMFAFQASGTDGIRRRSVINRCLQDINVASRHTALSSMTARSAGRALIDD